MNLSENKEKIDKIVLFETLRIKKIIKFKQKLLKVNYNFDIYKNAIV